MIEQRMRHRTIDTQMQLVASIGRHENMRPKHNLVIVRTIAEKLKIYQARFIFPEARQIFCTVLKGEQSPGSTSIAATNRYYTTDTTEGVK